MSDNLAFGGDGRFFMSIDGQACGTQLSYHSCVKMTGLQKSFGDIEPVQCPDPQRSGEFVEVATLQGQDSRWTATIVGRKQRKDRSLLSQLLLKKRCEFAFHVHYGRCTDPSNPTDFETALIFEGVRISEYATGDLIAMTQGEQAVIEETISFSAADVYEIYAPHLYETDKTTVLRGSASSVAYAAPYCEADCEEACARAYALRLPNANDSATCGLYIDYTLDGGATWSRVQTDCFLGSGAIWSYRVHADSKYLYVTANGLNCKTVVARIPLSKLTCGSGAADAPVAVGFVVYNTFLYGSILYMAGETGQIATYNTKTGVVEVVESGTFLTHFYAINGIDEDNVAAGGASGSFAVREDGGLFRQVTVYDTGVAVTADITAVYMRADGNWIVGTRDGRILCGYDDGCGAESAVWTKLATLTGCIVSIKFATRSIGYAAVGYPASLWRSIDGGASWHQLFDNFNQIPTDATFHDLSVCQDDPGQFLAVGTRGIAALGCDPLTAQSTAYNGFVIRGY